MFDEKRGSASQTLKLFNLCVVKHARATVWSRLRTQRDNKHIAAIEPAPPDVSQTSNGLIDEAVADATHEMLVAKWRHRERDTERKLRTRQDCAK